MAKTKSGIYYIDDYNEQADTPAYSQKLAESIDEAFLKEQEDISNIKDEQKKQNEDIENNKAINEENSNSINAVLNAMPTARSEGEQVTLENTIDFKFKKFKAKGNSKQEIRIGKNAIIFEDVESTISGVAYSIKNGVITLNGTATGIVNIYSKTINLLAGDYTLSKNAEGTFDKGTATSTPVILLQKKQEDGSYQTYSKCEIGAGTTNNFISKTLEKGTYRLRIFTAIGNILNNFSWKPQLEQGAAFSGFEQGGAMPSTEFPSEIRNVGDNGNLYDKDNPNILDTPIDSNGLGGNVKDTYKTVWIPCKPNTTYAVSKKYDATKNRFALAYTSEEPNYSQQVEGYISNTYACSLTIKTNPTAKYLLAYVWIAGGNTTYQEMLDSIKIEKGVRATVNSGYGRGSIEIDVYNKNLLDQDLELFQGNYNNSGNIIANADKRIDKYIFLQKGNYILWSTSNNWINVLIYDKNKELLSVKNSNTNKKLTFTLDEDGYIRFGFNPTVESLKVFQLERNTEKTTSEEHKQQIIVFPFELGQRLMEGDYLAEDGIHHKRKQIVLDGTENWSASNNTFYTDTIKDYNRTSFVPLSNFFRGILSINLASNMTENNTVAFNNITDYDRLYIKSDKFNTIDSFKTWLSSQKEAGTPVTIEYELAEEEIETYTDEQKKAYEQIKNAKSYDGQTNIYCDNETSAIIEAEAYANINSIINNLQAQIISNASEGV